MKLDRSIKKVLPVLAPELGYDRLEIGNGADAQAEYRMYVNEYAGYKKSKSRKKQLKYLMRLNMLQKT